ncbi:MAG: glutamyl-tRNA reductase, partial [Candidatus Promineifilaceae bacterium]
RRETAISAQPASLSALALAEAQQLAGDLRRRPVLVIGVGEVGQALLKGLRARHARQVAVTNRSLALAEQLAAGYGYQAYRFSDLVQALATADIVFSATAAPQPILNPALVGAALAARPERPLLLVDLAVPRDVAPEVAGLAGVRLLHLDELRASLDQALAGRRQATPQVEAIIATEVAALEQELQQLAVRPLIASLRQRAERIRRGEMARARRHLGEVDAETWGHIQHLSQALVNQLLHEPTVRLKEKAGDQQAAAYAAAVRELFDLP